MSVIVSEWVRELVREREKVVRFWYMMFEGIVSVCIGIVMWWEKGGLILICVGVGGGEWY